MTETPGINPTDDVPPVPPVPPPPAPQYGAAPGYVAPQYAAAPPAPLSDSDQRLWATLAHIGPIIIGFVAPLVIWLIYKDRGRYVADQAKEALNFQITVTIAATISSILIFAIIGLVLLPIVLIAALVLMIMAAIAANKGQAYRYPVTLRLVR
jgi:uncharacterized protein